MLFVPNFLWTKRQPADYGRYAKNENRVLLGFERVGEVIVTVAALVFSDLNPRFPLSPWAIWLGASLLSMLLYEVFWIRYFGSPRTMRDFYRSLLGIPVAGATLPVIAFALLAVYGGNPILFFGTAILGIGHIGIHLRHAEESRRDEGKASASDPEE